jgi:hypothetical protein
MHLKPAPILLLYSGKHDPELPLAYLEDTFPTQLPAPPLSLSIEKPPTREGEPQ